MRKVGAGDTLHDIGKGLVRSGVRGITLKAVLEVQGGRFDDVGVLHSGWIEVEAWLWATLVRGISGRVGDRRVARSRAART